MPPAKLALAAGLAAISLSACGTAAKPQAGTLKAETKSHKAVDDPRKTHIKCLSQQHVPVAKIEVGGNPGLQVGSYPAGPRVVFEPTPGDAQGLQIVGQVQSAEVIGAALLYPNQGSNALLQKVEDCVAKGVSG
ncbi:MAG TPA: hypothetical protein VGH45_13625 [Solirubrobacteraceae bacterium]|jgi:hypothetical protein